jgi:hypothetical protein
LYWSGFNSLEFDSHENSTYDAGQNLTSGKRSLHSRSYFPGNNRVKDDTATRTIYTQIPGQDEVANAQFSRTTSYITPGVPDSFDFENTNTLDVTQNLEIHITWQAGALFDVVVNGAKLTVPLSAINRAYLNWKYSQCPTIETQTFGVVPIEAYPPLFVT